MPEKYELLRKDKPIGIFVKDDQGVELSFYEGVDRKLYPFYFEASLNKGKLKYNQKETMRFIKTRVMPRRRMDSIDVLSKAGLKKYDEWEIFKKTRGRSGDDTLSLRMVD